MKQKLSTAVLLIGLVPASPRLFAQAPASGSTQNPPAAGQKTPPANNGNPFPEDENSVPVMPSKDAPDIPRDIYDNGRASLPAIDRDPVRSPDDPSADSSQQSGFSSSLSGIDTMQPTSDDEPTGKHRKKGDVVEPDHKETAKEDETVGQYYLDNKNWKAALSRLQSALVLDPENPDVYWGLAESARHLNDFVNARAYYQKVVDYDPDSRHAKDAAKALKDPELANAKPPSGSAH